MELETKQIAKFIIRYSRNPQSKPMDARVLHKLLGLRGGFTTWFNRHRQRLNLIAGEHYCPLLLKRKSTSGNKPRNYLLSPKTVLQIAVVNTGQVGRQIERINKK